MIRQPGMRFFRLSGWQRLWILVSVLYAIPVVLFTNLELSSYRGESEERLQWAMEAERLVAAHVGVSWPSASRLFDEHYNEVIKRIYTMRLASSPTEMVDPKDIERNCEKEVQSMYQRIHGGPGGSGMFPIGPRREEDIDQCKLKVLRTMIERGRLTDLKGFNPGDFKIELARLETDYEARLKEARKERIKFVGIGFLAWLVPVLAVYVLGLAAGWVYRGFKGAATDGD
jgi:hypothetical protein